MVEIWFLALGLAGLGNRPEARSPAKVWGRPPQVSPAPGPLSAVIPDLQGAQKWTAQ